MTEQSASRHIQIQLLGEVRLLLDGAVARGRSAQKRRMALLAFLVRSPDRTAHRERLLGLLWPEHAPDAARRLLNESIYVIRRELGAEVLLTVGDRLQLSPTVVSDVDSFVEASRGGNVVEAERVYRGALFGSWSAGASPEFEQWAETERAHLARQYADIVAKAAALYERHGDYAAAARLFARLGAQDADSVVAAEGEARALAMSGEPMLAVRRLDQFADRWREEFGGSAPTSVHALRASIVSGAAAARPTRPPATQAVPVPQPVPEPAATPAPAPTPAPALVPATAPGRRLGWRNVASVVAGALFLTYGAIYWGQRNQPAEAANASNEAAGRYSRIVILAQGLATRDSGLAYLRDAITTAVTNQLSVNSFGVASRTEAQAVERGRITLDSLIVLKQLGTLVEFVYESRAQRLRVTGRVIDAATREAVTSSVFERPLAEALQLETELTRFTADALRLRLRQSVALRDTAEGSRDETARKLLISAVRLRNDAEEVQRNGFAYDGEAARDMLFSADTLVQRAQRIERFWPELAVERARIWRSRARTLPDVRDRLAVYDSARQFVDAVLPLSPDNAAALALRGELLYRQAAFLAAGGQDTIRLRRADADLRRSLALEPTRADAWLVLSRVQDARGQTAASLVSARRAIEHDAFLTEGEQAYFALFAGELLTHRFTEALQWCRRGRMVYPESSLFYECELTLLRERPAQPNDETVAWALVATLDSLSALSQRVAPPSYALPYRLVVAAGISARAGNTRRARAALARAQALVARDSAQRLDFSFDEPWVHWMLGDRQRAVRNLQALVAELPAMTRILSTSPLYGDLLEDVLRTTASAPTR